MRLLGVAAAAAREAAFPRGGRQPLRNKERAELALASRRAALHRVTVATLVRRVERQKFVLGRAHAPREGVA